MRHPEDLNSEDEIKYLEKLKPDVVVVVAYGKIIPEKTFKYEKYKVYKFTCFLIA